MVIIAVKIGESDWKFVSSGGVGGANEGLHRADRMAIDN